MLIGALASLTGMSFAHGVAAASLDQVTGDVVAVIRKIRPQVVLTFDPIGGYRHPDHIAMHNATVQAFHQADDTPSGLALRVVYDIHQGPHDSQAQTACAPRVTPGLSRYVIPLF